MNMTRKIVGLMFVCFGLAAFIAACDDLDAAPCTSDEDCVSDELCISESCLELCESTEECTFEGDTCMERPDGEGTEKVCVPPTGEDCTMDSECSDANDICYQGDICIPTCSDDSECIDGLEKCQERDDSAAQDQKICVSLAEAGEECSDHGDCLSGICVDDECVDPEEHVPYTQILIQDVTDIETPNRCDDSTGGFDTAGAKIMQVVLYDNDGNEVYAEALDFNEGDNTNFGNPLLLMDGFAPDYSQDCPVYEGESTFSEDYAAALGCGGSLFLHFPRNAEDNDWAPIAIEDGFQIDVRAYGLQCSEEYQTAADGSPPLPQSQNDPYDVVLCKDDPNDGLICDYELALAAGGMHLGTVTF